VPSPSLAETDLKRLGIVPGLELRWVAPEHQSDLSFHRARFLLSANQIADCQGFVSAKQ
jgi:putative restriction endonuclease